MKINLLWNSNDILNGYENIDPFGYEQPGKLCFNLNQLPYYDWSIEEIRAVNVLGYYDQSESFQVFNHWLSKVALGGKFVFGELHAELLLDQFSRGNMGLAQLTHYLYNGRKNIISMDDVLANMQGYQITKKNISGLFYVVEGTRVHVV